MAGVPPWLGCTHIKVIIGPCALWTSFFSPPTSHSWEAGRRSVLVLSWGGRSRRRRLGNPPEVKGPARRGFLSPPGRVEGHGASPGRASVLGAELPEGGLNQRRLGVESTGSSESPLMMLSRVRSQPLLVPPSLPHAPEEPWKEDQSGAGLPRSQMGKLSPTEVKAVWTKVPAWCCLVETGRLGVGGGDHCSVQVNGRDDLLLFILSFTYFFNLVLKHK